MAHASIEGGAVAVSDAVPAWRTWSKRALKLFAAGVAGVPIAFAVGYSLKSTMVIAVGLGLSTALFVIGFVCSIVAIVRIVKSSDRRRAGMAVAVIGLPMLTGAVFSLLGAFLAFWASVGFARGRQLRKRGKILLPP
ncbi:MAG: hypothetical protein ABR567_14250, partial [Myxococcales bacterium]